MLAEHHAKALLAPFGLPKSYERLAESAVEAAEAAGELGYPVALKVASPDIAHKTEAGGVLLGLQDQQSVAAAYDHIIASVQRYKSDARIEGVLVQKMAPRGRELVIGMVNDATFGPIMMVGLGGTMVELMGDVVHRPAPVDVAEATDMLHSLKSAPLLTGFRGSASIDLKPAAELIASLSHAAFAYRDRIAEMELNPVILHEDGSGLTIADALIMLKE
jgi:acetate---CoA ligase (ADP-forming)